MSCMFQVDQLTAELSSERSNLQKVDGERSSLERLSKELKAKLEEMESQLKTKVKTATQALESKIVNLEEQLDAESRYETYSDWGWG
jgi:myosin protein heavy chain